jgi:hypothetical protein
MWMQPEKADIKVQATVAVIRDSQRKFIAGSCVYIQHVDSAASAEAIAMRNGLALTEGIGCTGVQAESDAMEVVSACNGEDIWWSSSAAIYANFMASVAVIGKVDFKHYPQETNVVAHTLARFCFHSKNSCNWADEPPSCIVSKLMDDVIVI